MEVLLHQAHYHYLLMVKESLKLNPFHLAFPVYNLEETKQWYTKTLGCKIGREASRWVDFNFFGHQISAHLTDAKNKELPTNVVDEKNIPIRHFGIILDWSDWKKLSQKLNQKKMNFIVEPHIRFKGKSGEQATMFIKDPSENILEFKSFKNFNSIFEK